MNFSTQLLYLFISNFCLAPFHDFYHFIVILIFSDVIFPIYLLSSFLSSLSIFKTDILKSLSIKSDVFSSSCTFFVNLLFLLNGPWFLISLYVLWFCCWKLGIWRKKTANNYTYNLHLAYRFCGSSAFESVFGGE